MGSGAFVDRYQNEPIDHNIGVVNELDLMRPAANRVGPDGFSDQMGDIPMGQDLMDEMSGMMTY